ncbi:MAG: hypothetical protein KBA30_05005 [Clostridia bacterium]|nr:hypothetical protein [Clostridia bacterium]
MQQTAIATRTPLWGRFDRDRRHLERQYAEPSYDPDTGLDPEALECAAERCLADNASRGRVVQKAALYALILDHARIGVDPLDFFADALQHGNLLSRLQGRWWAEVKQGPLADETAWMDTAIATGYVDGLLDLGHTSPDWTGMLRQGLTGLLETARRRRAAFGAALTPEQADFYDAVDIVYSATIRLAGRLSRQARRLAGLHPEHAERLTRVADALGQVPAGPPRTLHEALQFAYLMHQMIEMEGERVRSMGGFDRLYLPYYRADIAAGRLDREQAKELIKYFWIKFFAVTRGVENGKNFYFAGCLPDGSDAANELTDLALEAYDELDTTDPKLSVRIGRGTPDAVLARIARILRQGKTAFVLTNDDVAIPALVKHGKTLEDARNHLLIGCYEPTVEGLEIACNMSLRINLAKAVELALHNGTDPVSGLELGPRTGEPREMTEYGMFEEAVFAQIDAQVDRATAYVRRFEPWWPSINPSPVLAGTFPDCLATGRDIGQAGPKYNNTGCMGAGLANIADSLMAVRRLVYEERRLPMDSLIAALDADFVGSEDLHRHIVHRIPKWGNDQPDVDGIARRVADRYTARVNRTPNARGGGFRASMFTLDYRYKFGKRMGATPDGRRRGAYLAGGVGAMTARDINGLTAQILSVTKLDFTDIPNGSVLDIYLHPSAVQGEDGIAALVALIRTYFARGGFGIQFNVFDSKTLLDARLHPEDHATLQVRVCGWNVYFTSMSPYEQEQYIEANKHLL